MEGIKSLPWRVPGPKRRNPINATNIYQVSEIVASSLHKELDTMPYSNIISALPGNQPFLPIIPAKTFKILFKKVLGLIEGIITSTERKLFCLFDRYCYLGIDNIPANLSDRDILEVLS